ncbi:hypothetical protein [Cupriavidus sp. DL-D2]|uniref:hypothetical protein n=1 Tax=Cupriavidus sp. DL-D2 TaxID=3144974 RepID=UPI003212C953
MSSNHTRQAPLPPTGFVLGIQTEELYSAFVERTVGAITVAIRGDYRDHREACRRYIALPMSLPSTVGPFSALCPALDLIPERHTALPIVSPFEKASVATLIRARMVESQLPRLDTVRRLCFLSRDYLWELGVCPECAWEEYHDLGCVVWKRALAIKGNMFCLRHRCPTWRTCSACKRGYTLKDYGGVAAPNCVHCGNPMEGKIGADTEAVSLALARDIDDVLAGTLEGVYAEDLLPMLQDAAQAKGLVGNQFMHRLNELAHDTGISRWCDHAVGFRNPMAFLKPVAAGLKFGLSPVLNILGLRMMMGSIKEVRKLVDERRRRSRMASLSVDYRFPPPVRDAARALLLSILDEEPLMQPTRLQSEFADKFGALIAFDRQWFDDAVDQHAIRARGARAHKTDLDYARAVEQRAKDYGASSSAPRLTQQTLLKNILSVGCFNKHHQLYPRTDAVIQNHWESDLAWLRRRVRCLAKEHPECLDDRLRQLVAQIQNASRHRVCAGLARMEAMVETSQSTRQGTKNRETAAQPENAVNRRRSK